MKRKVFSFTIFFMFCLVCMFANFQASTAQNNPPTEDIQKNHEKILGRQLKILASVSSGPLSVFGPIKSGSPDSGTCGNNWAEDSYQRYFVVLTVAIPTNERVQRYLVIEYFLNATFVTLAGPSPGACQNGGNNGNTLPQGRRGVFTGDFVMLVTGVYNPSGILPDSGSTTADFVKSFFGSNATYEIPSFLFFYKTLATRVQTWRNASMDYGGNSGDIYGIAPLLTTPQEDILKEKHEKLIQSILNGSYVTNGDADWPSVEPR